MLCQFASASSAGISREAQPNQSFKPTPTARLNSGVFAGPGCPLLAGSGSRPPQEIPVAAPPGGLSRSTPESLVSSYRRKGQSRPAPAQKPGYTKISTGSFRDSRFHCGAMEMAERARHGVREGLLAEMHAHKGAASWPIPQVLRRAGKSCNQLVFASRRLSTSFASHESASHDP